jgi:hypothetical protein
VPQRLELLSRDPASALGSPDVPAQGQQASV